MNVSDRDACVFLNRLADLFCDLGEMQLDEALQFATCVIADYARANYGDRVLHLLAHIMYESAGRPLPESLDRETTH